MQLERPSTPGCAALPPGVACAQPPPRLRFPGGAQAGRPRNWSPPRPWGGDGKGPARSPSRFSEPRLPDPQRPQRPHLRSSPGLRACPAQGRGSVPGAPRVVEAQRALAGVPAPRPLPPALTVRARRSGRAASQAEQQQERQQAARRAARAPGPPAHAAAAAASLPALPRLLLRPQGAEIRRRAPRGGGRPGRFRRRAGERRAPWGSRGRACAPGGR